MEPGQPSTNFPWRDACGRAITYLRISLTPSCNLRCVYCLPEQVRHPVLPEGTLLTNEELVRIVTVLAGRGVRKIRLTGGEPLLRPGLLGLVAGIKKIPGIEELALSTNGILLERWAKPLKEAGVDRINVSCDSLKTDRFQRITRGGELASIWRGLAAAWDAKLTPLKLNCVLLKGINDDEIEAFARLTRLYPLHLRFIELMPLGQARSMHPTAYFSAAEAKRRCEAIEPLKPVSKTSGAGPAEEYQWSSARGTIGFISPLSNKFCASCNRLRLTADGWLRPCLDWTEGVDLKAVVRGARDTGGATRLSSPKSGGAEPAVRGGDGAGLESAILETIGLKREGHSMERLLVREDQKSASGWEGSRHETMCAIGG